MIPLLAISIVLQVTAAVLALRLIPLTGRRAAWMAVAAATVLMALRRGLQLLDVARGHVPGPYEPTAELTGVAVSALLVLGLLLIRPLFVGERRAREELREREERFRALAESTPDAIVVSDAEGRILFWNRGAERIFGYGPEEIAGKSVALLVPEVEREAHRRGLARVRETGETRLVGRTVELRGIRRDGGEFPVELSLGMWEAGGRPFFAAVIRDITHRRRLAEDLRRMNRALETLLHYHEAIVRASDEVETVREVCRILVEEGGYRFAWAGLCEEGPRRVVRPVASWGEGAGYLDAVTVTADDSDLGRGPTGTAVRTGRPDVCRDIASDPRFAPWREEALRRGFRSSAAFPLLVGTECVGALNLYSAEAEAFDEAEVGLLQALSRDLAQAVWTHRVRGERESLEAQLRQAQKMEALGEVTGGIAHDLRNLLTVILTSAELLRERLEEADEEGRAALEDLEKAARSGASLTRKLLAFGRREELRREPLDLASHVGELANTLRRILPETIEVEVNAAEDLPPVLADPNALEQIVVNLATNSRDAMPEGGTLRLGLSRVRFSPEDRAVHGAVETGDFVCLTVSDTGTGMERGVLERVFEPFFTTKRDRGGTGLGMAVVYGLVRQHGGFIRGYSEEGVGTTFKVYFPVGEEAPGAEAAEEGAVPVRGGRETVLVAEDDAALRRAARRALERFGYTVILAEDGEEALEILRDRAEEVDLVLADIVMPRLGGWELYRAARGEGIRVPFLFASGHTEEGVRELRGLEEGVPFLEKPWSVEELARKVREVLDGAGETPGAG